MQRVSKYKVVSNGDLLFVKRDLNNYLKNKISDELLNIYSFAIMELGTNLYKYPGCGEIWVFQDGDYYFLAVLDKGGGIDNL